MLRVALVWMSSLPSLPPKPTSIEAIAAAKKPEEVRLICYSEALTHYIELA